MIITIDGPAGAGKSSVARKLAERLGFDFLDTGAMYRAVTWSALQQGIDVTGSQTVAKIAASLVISFAGERVMVSGSDVTDALRSSEVTVAVSEVADNAEVREQLVMLQREIASSGNFVCEGRDQGTVVFPNADCKIFLTASSYERARRRFQQIQPSRPDVDYQQILNDQRARDQRDIQRPVGRLLKAEDAVELVTDHLTLDEVVDRLEEIARSKIAALQQ